jgi:hypothetical protein
MTPVHPARRLLTISADGDEVLAQAARIARDGGGDQLAHLRARRFPEAGWPGERPPAADYELAGTLLERAGRTAHAHLLTGIAGTERGLEPARLRWRSRYDGMAYEGTARVLDLERREMLTLGAAHRGVDGAIYQAGGFNDRPVLHCTPVAAVRVREACELITGWDGPLAAREWMHSRLPSADGPLRWPAGAASRVEHEKHVAGFVLRVPWELSRYRAGRLSLRWVRWGHVRRDPPLRSRHLPGRRRRRRRDGRCGGTDAL